MNVWDEWLLQVSSKAGQHCVSKKLTVTNSGFVVRVFPVNKSNGGMDNLDYAKKAI